MVSYCQLWPVAQCVTEFVQVFPGPEATLWIYCCWRIVPYSIFLGWSLGRWRLDNYTHKLAISPKMHLQKQICLEDILWCLDADHQKIIFCKQLFPFFPSTGLFAEASECPRAYPSPTPAPIQDCLRSLATPCPYCLSMLFGCSLNTFHSVTF